MRQSALQSIEEQTTKLLHILLDLHLLLAPAKGSHQLLRRNWLLLLDQLVEEQLKSSREFVLVLHLHREEQLSEVDNHVPELGEVEEHLQIAVHVACVALVDQPSI